uniref:Uncharacterized protein n=1 Tax=Takifugu rubripes TaxID=31033 RepID=A0A674NAF3_TAKRU
MKSIENWVGTWRPHRPRGPIAALYSSPGPKYALPGLTGAYSPERADRLNFHSAPACSLSGSYFICFSCPGPASYTLPPVLGPNTVVTPAALAYSISGRNKSDSDLTKSPGLVYKVVDPSIYRPKAPQYSMTGRNFPPDDSTKKPGPGAHYPEKVLIMHELSPSFTFGIRHSQYISSLVVDEFNKRSLTNERDKAATALEPKAAW